MANYSSGSKRQRLICCVVGTETFGINLSSVRSVERVDRLQRNFGSSELIGWLGSAYDKISVYSLAVRLNLPRPTIQIDNRIIIVSTESDTYGLLVDQASEVIDVQVEDKRPLPSVLGDATKYFESIVWKDEELLLSLETEHWGSASFRKPSGSELDKPVVDAEIGEIIASQSKRRGQLLLFSPAKSALRKCVLGVSLSQVLEILEPLPLTPVPCAPDFVLGLANWRRHTVPVIDLNSRFGIVSSEGDERRARSESRLLIARATHTSQVCGFMIQSNPKTQKLPIPHEPRVGAVPIPRVWTRGIFELENEETLVLPDLDRLIA